ncbi:Crp/Fnr family transcriptional regulator [Acidovorax sp. MR-S7]|uniref:Crp/Fnr family transcriptional regulator n=1 Tax=Acidovorax sp. MR-S7 TaxID=1268622 RepID=UPI0003760E64|nr:Crp/Fnr family transcriptional regulator [Acidovorax sp. MR-S7]GAD23759.1 hypothetical protein AVS7_03519 [Acidovorax sp. MR-S7]
MAFDDGLALAAQHHAALERCGRVARMPAGTRLFDAGQSDDRIFLVRAGRVRTFAIAADGQEITTGVWSRGSVMGLLGAMEQGGKVLSAQTLDAAELLVLQEERLHRLVLDHPDLGWGLMRLLARMAASSIQRALRLASASAPQRLVDALVMLAELPEARHGGAAAAVIEGISQETLAGMTGASRPWVAQAMGDLAQRGLLVPSRLRIAVPDVARLRAAVSTG